MTLTELVRMTLEEDVGPGDLTTEACVDANARGTAQIYAKQALVVAGHAPAGEVFRQLGATYESRAGEGESIDDRVTIAHIEGPLRSLLTGERSALNFLMRLCGIATHVRAVVAAAGGVRVVDTRKTTPLLRALEKDAVRAGGAGNHRFGLFDGILIKDNHIVAAGGIAAAVRRARLAAHPLMRIECEVETLVELQEALEAGVDVVLLDNMDDAVLLQAVERTAGRATLEASGNMTAERISRLRSAGLDYFSMGGLIHQARWADLSMRILPVGR